MTVDGISIKRWDLSHVLSQHQTNSQSDSTRREESAQVQYTNAKVLLVGESGAGKTGLSRRLAVDKWELSDSTVGAWATQWKLNVESESNDQREIWLWDFGGQADQRLIHQLYMDEAALVALVFDGQKADLFDALTLWNRDLSRSAQNAARVLVAGRVDAGSVRASKKDIDTFVAENGFKGFVETSAKTGQGCEALKSLIVSSIQWQDLPWRSSPKVFHQLKQAIITLKDEGRALMRFNELRDVLKLRLPAPASDFTEQELHAVVGLLTGPGVVWELEFGSLILLQPERINQYAQAAIQTMREDASELGTLGEDRVLSGNLSFGSIDRLPSQDESLVLIAMHKLLVERGLCLRHHSEKGTLLIFPSYYKRQRPELTGHPAVLVSYTYRGFLDEIYATLVVGLHHTAPFRHHQLWHYAADFQSKSGKQIGLKQTACQDGSGQLEIYCDPSVALGEKILFIRYVHEHLNARATQVTRYRHYVCACGTQVSNYEAVRRRLDEGKMDIGCAYCDKRVSLWDDLEEMFVSESVIEQVRELEEQTLIELDNESKERVLVGEVTAMTALAKQISREKPVSDHGIDMEIEFKDASGAASGALVYLQLKSGDSYLRTRKQDGVEIFDIADERHAEYWMKQPVPVMLVIRNSDGRIRWMEIREHLRDRRARGLSTRLIEFRGTVFNVNSILATRKWVFDRVATEQAR